jgi:hypothetical protein
MVLPSHHRDTAPQPKWLRPGITRQAGRQRPMDLPLAAGAAHLRRAGIDARAAQPWRTL